MNLAELESEIASTERKLEILKATKVIANGLPGVGEQIIAVVKLAFQVEGRRMAGPEPEQLPLLEVEPESPPPDRKSIIEAAVRRASEVCARADEGGCEGPLRRTTCPDCKWFFSTCEVHSKGKALGGMLGGHRRGHSKRGEIKPISPASVDKPVVATAAPIPLFAAPPKPPSSQDLVQCKHPATDGGGKRACGDWVLIHEAQKHLKEKHNALVRFSAVRLYFHDPKVPNAGRPRSETVNDMKKRVHEDPT